VSYGARALTSGGWQSIPEQIFPGGALIGCAAGYMNAPRLKAIHSAIRSGIAAADSIAEALAAGRANDRLTDLPARTLATGIGRELRRVRNVKPLWSRFGNTLGVVLAGVDMWIGSLLRFSPFGTLRHAKADADTLWPVTATGAQTYPRPDGKLTFDRTSSVFLANIAHDEDQPVHLRLNDPAVPIRDTLPAYGAEPAPRYCPAGVYEVADVGGGPVFRISPANCVHCKTCDIKDPARNIDWVPPEGGSGPNYVGM
jgi:electron-transferring-flavoprotein dehydrogenase